MEHPRLTMRSSLPSLLSSGVSSGARSFSVAAAVIAAVAVAGLASGCVPEFDDVEGEVTRVCVLGIVMPFAGESGDAAVTRYDLSEADIDEDKLAGHTVTLDSVVLEAGLGIDDFGFADRIQVDLVDLDRQTDGLQARLVDLDRVGPVNPIHTRGATGDDLSGYIADSSTGLEMALYGDVPATPWTATLDVCLAVDDAGGAD